MQGTRPIAFMSKKLGVRNQSLSTYEKELLALFTAVTKWKHYLLGAEFMSLGSNVLSTLYTCYTVNKSTCLTGP